MNNTLYVAGEGGNLYKYDLNTKNFSLVWKKEDDDETLMGLESKNGYFYIGDKSKVYKLDKDFNIVSKSENIEKNIFLQNRKPDFHQMSIYNDELYITATHSNKIYLYDLDLNLLNKFLISPPIKYFFVIKRHNYNHINHIFPYKNRFYICLNWLTRKQHGSSGVAVLNKDFKEIDRFQMGREAHNFSIIEDKMYILCGSSGKIKNINHTHKAGLMVDGKLVWEHDPNKVFCKDFSMDDKYIYIMGSDIKERSQRGNIGGTIFVLDKNFNQVDEIRFENTGGFVGCMLDNYDLTKIYE